MLLVACLIGLCVAGPYSDIADDSTDYTLWFPTPEGFDDGAAFGAVACFEFTDDDGDYPGINAPGFFVVLNVTSDSASIDAFNVTYVHTSDDNGEFIEDASYDETYTISTVTCGDTQCSIVFAPDSTNIDTSFADYAEGGPSDGDLQCFSQDFDSDTVEIVHDLKRFDDPIYATDPKFFTMTFPQYKLLRW